MTVALHCKFEGDCNSETVVKIGQYLTKLRVQYLGVTFLSLLYTLNIHGVIIACCNRSLRRNCCSGCYYLVMYSDSIVTCNRRVDRANYKFIYNRRDRAY